MPILISCPACASKLKVDEQRIGKNVICPACRGIFTAQEADEAPKQRQLRDAERIRERPALAKRHVSAQGDGVKVAANPPPLPEVEVPAARSKSRPQDEPQEFYVEEASDEEESDEQPEQVPDDDEPRPEKKRKKKKKRKRDNRILEDRARRKEVAPWKWWAYGGGAVAATMFVLLCLAIFCDMGSWVKGYGFFMFVMMPISTVIFFVAMYLCSIWFEAIEIGEIHVAMFKAFLLLFLVNTVRYVPFGFYLVLPVWLIGLFTIFRCNLWEARVLIFMNCVLHFGATVIVFGLVLHVAGTGEGGGAFGGGFGGGGVGGAEDDDDFLKPNVRMRAPLKAPREFRKAGINQLWDLEDLESWGGNVEFIDPANRDEDEVIGIAFRPPKAGRDAGRVMGDAQLEHMQDFPRLQKLDLSGSAVTDAGLLHLRTCKGLRTLNVRGTPVTDAGVAALKKSLPRLNAVR